MSEVIGHPDLKLLFDYWLGKCQGRPMPTRDEIDPTELPGHVLRHLMLLEVVYEEARLRFRYRVVGEHIEDAYGHKKAGDYMDEALDLQGDYKPYVIGAFSTVVQERKPLYTENNYVLAGRGLPTLTRRLTLPLSDDGETVNMTLSGHAFERPAGEHAAFGADVRGFRELARYVYVSGSWMAA